MKDIPQSEIREDIEITQREIDQYQNELDVLNKDRTVNRLPIYIREGRIIEREDFIKKLKTLLK